MRKTEVGTENIYFEMESKRETEAGTYDEVLVADARKKIPRTARMSFETFAPGLAEKKRQSLTREKTTAFRQMLLIIAALVAVAFLTAVGALVLVLTMMMSPNGTTTSKDFTDVSGKRDHDYFRLRNGSPNKYVNFTRKSVNTKAPLPAAFSGQRPNSTESGRNRAQITLLITITSRISAK